MGADGAFERRRTELAEMSSVREADVPDDAVVESYQAQVNQEHGC